MSDNVFFTDDSYMPTGFGAEDYLIPKKPTIDWFSEPMQSGGVSYAGGLSNLSGNQSPINGGFSSPVDTGLPMSSASSFGDIDPSSYMPMRKRRSVGDLAMMRAADVTRIMSGDKNAYMGQTLDMALAEEKKLAEEDPEGKQIDINRAKVLSQKAYASNDPEFKKKCGRAIKQLLPKETQGMDDLTASEFMVSSEKMEIEKLKAATKLKQEEMKGAFGLQKQELANQGKITAQDLKNMSAERIADLRAKNNVVVAELKKMYDKEIAEGKYENALQVQQMITDRHELDNMAKSALEDKKQAGQNFRTVYTADKAFEGRQYAADKRLEGQTYAADQSLAARRYAADRSYDAAVVNANAKVASANLKKGELSPEEARKQWPTLKADFDAQQAMFQEGIDLMKRYELFGPVVGRQLSYGIGSDDQLAALGRVKQILAEAVQKRLEQVRKAAGTGRAADSEKEGARVIGYLTGDPTIPQETIMGALQLFMETSARAMNTRERELFGEEGAPKSESAKPALTIKSIKRVK